MARYEAWEKSQADAKSAAWTRRNGAFLLIYTTFAVTTHIKDAKMGTLLPLEKMSLEDKIRAMETIWDNLCQKAECVPSPSWHKNILDEREKVINEGKEEFIDWGKAKKHIQDKFSRLQG